MGIIDHLSSCGLRSIYIFIGNHIKSTLISELLRYTRETTTLSTVGCQNNSHRVLTMEKLIWFVSLFCVLIILRGHVFCFEIILCREWIFWGLIMTFAPVVYIRTLAHSRFLVEYVIPTQTIIIIDTRPFGIKRSFYLCNVVLRDILYDTYSYCPLRVFVKAWAAKHFNAPPQFLCGHYRHHNSLQR